MQKIIGRHPNALSLNHREVPMIRIGQKIDDFEFDAYQADEIKTVRFSSYKGKWLVLLFYPVDFASIRLTELVEAVAHYDHFRKLGAEILAVSMNTPFVRKAWQEHSSSIAKTARLLVADPATEIWRHFRTPMEDLTLAARGTFIIDPNGVLKARAFTTRASTGLIPGLRFGQTNRGEFENCLTLRRES